jgi:hypothetical protein
MRCICLHASHCSSLAVARTTARPGILHPTFYVNGRLAICNHQTLCRVLYRLQPRTKLLVRENACMQSSRASNWTATLPACQTRLWCWWVPVSKHWACIILFNLVAIAACHRACVLPGYEHPCTDQDITHHPLHQTAAFLSRGCSRRTVKAAEITAHAQHYSSGRAAAAQPHAPQPDSIALTDCPRGATHPTRLQPNCSIASPPVRPTAALLVPQSGQLQHC